MFTKAKADPPDRPKRFYKTAEAAAHGDGFGVRLDGRVLKTPQGRPLALPTMAVAELVAREWAGQRDNIVVADMPATRLAFTAVDRVSGARAEVAAEVARYAGADLLCYFAEAPDALMARQQAQWAPLLDWAAAELGLAFAPSAGIVHRSQPAETLEAVEALALRLDDYALTALAHAAALLGSAILALALERGRIGGEEAFDLSRLDEAFQEERWGVDAEAADRALRLRAEAKTLERWFRALARPEPAAA
jgi:chaperone required for assembly of F1-ATPase